MGLAESTIYKVENQIVTKDESSKNLDQITRSADNASRSMGALKTAAAGFVVGAGLSLATKSLISYNAELEDSQTVMAGMLTMYTNASMDAAWDRAGKSVERFSEMAAKSSLTTKEIVTMATLIERPLMMAGTRMQDIEQISFKTASAAKAFGIEAEMAALDVEQAMMGTLSSKDRFARSLLGAINVDYKKFNKMSGEDRVATWQRALDSTDKMTERQGRTFHGVVSTFVDNIQIAAGKIGKPLFEAVSSEVRGWNDWLVKNDDKLQSMGKTVGGALVEGFRYVKGAVQFVAEHADTFITIGKVWAGVKLVQGVGGGLNSLVGSVGGGATSAIGSLAALRAWAKRDTPFGMAGDNSTDGGTFWSGGLDVTGGKGGAGGTALTMKGVGQNLPLIGQAAAAGFAIGTVLNRLTGASDGLVNIFTSISDAGSELAGGKSSYALAQRFDSVTRSMGIFDQAILKAAKDLAPYGGAASTQSAANLVGTVNQWQRQINTLEDIQAGRIGKSKSGTAAKIWGVSDEHMANEAQKAALRSAGFDDDEINKLYGQGGGSAAARSSLIAKLRSKSTTSSSVAGVAGAATDVEIALAMRTMTKDQRESIDVQKGTQAVMMEMVRALAEGKAGPGLDEVKRILLDNTDPFKSQMRLNQNITNNIKVEMSAKDPDRWMAELDAKVQRKIRAPSQARNALRQF